MKASPRASPVVDHRTVMDRSSGSARKEISSQTGGPSTGPGFWAQAGRERRTKKVGSVFIMVRLSDRAIQREISYRGSGGYCTSKPAMSVAVQRTIGIGACRTHCMAPVARSLAPGQSRLSSTACHKGQVGPWRGGKCGCAVCRNRSNCRPDHACPANSPGPSLVRCHTGEDAARTGPAPSAVTEKVAVSFPHAP